jgi:hypothetical protein
MVSNGPVGTELDTMAGGPALHKAKTAPAHTSLIRSFISMTEGGEIGRIIPQNGV